MLGTNFRFHVKFMKQPFFLLNGCAGNNFEADAYKKRTRGPQNHDMTTI